MSAFLRRLLCAIGVVVSIAAAAHARELAGRVIDADSGAAIADAIVTADGHAVRTDAGGRFDIEVTGASLGGPRRGLRTPQYRCRGRRGDANTAQALCGKSALSVVLWHRQRDARATPRSI